MSSGITHTKASLVLGGSFIVGGLLLQDIHCFEYATGALLGILIQPDLDVDNGFIGDRFIRNKSIRLSMIWDSIWHMYRKSLKHGGPLSHYPIIGTLGRIAYLYFMLVASPHFLIYYTFDIQWDLFYVLKWYFLVILQGWRIILGLMSSDFIHWGLDIAMTSGELSFIHKLKRTYVRILRFVV